MSAAVPLPGPARLRAPPTVRLLAWPLGWLAACAAYWNLPLNNDVSWQFWVARQLRHGFAFGADIFETNPPLWFWEAVPASALADRLGVAATHLAVAATLANTAVSLALTAELSPRRRRAPEITGLGVLLATLPVLSFGEREHLGVLGALPYAALIAARFEGASPSRGLALAVGLFAALQFALKPYFALPPLMLEGWLALRLRGSWRPVRAETLALAAVTAAYALAVAAFAPAWWTRVVPIARAAYGDFAPPFAWLVTRQAYLPCWILAATALLIARPRSPRIGAAVLTAAGFGGCYLLQGKGFPYHALPLTVSLCWALWLLLCNEARSLLTVAARRPLAGLALAAAFGAAALIGPYREPSLGALDQRIDNLPPGTVVAVISAHSWHAFPLVERRRFVWPLRAMFALMPLPAILREGPSARGLALRRATLDPLAVSLARCTPQSVLVDDPDASPMLPKGTNYLAFLQSDPRLAALLARYRLTARDRSLQLLTLRPGAPRSERGCFTAAPDAD